ncbi:TonB-dependent receptor [Aliifodinibius sp. S!AR15-10]|uniref:SusC/RagA family TonB-linked outer membrane protein n=1 Tax=Aliifodinibius sp. S!AR15-10 TaxID=2950437 RepID=UPI002857E207|nr:TonB-dependent receptor [Aliifodinibius sp. S!AR15-10]MDR8392543.1 TonB-dependent receptor [Aliifodinibius sp. S!AR15-10]
MKILKSICAILVVAGMFVPVTVAQDGFDNALTLNNSNSSGIWALEAEGAELRYIETVSGQITDNAGEVLPGVNILVSGTTIGTTSDTEGNWELNVPSLQDTLVFSFVGFQTQVVPIEGRTEIDVAMVPQTYSGEELVVVGYGTQTRETLTGSVSSVSGGRIEKVPVTNMANSLTGQLPGVVTVNQSGEPGYDGATIRIRGEHTLNNNEPLVVIDGVPDRSGGLDRLNPRDIENISVLKDASAAIYGSRAANGVILITTKRGRVGAPQFTLDLNQGFNQPTRIPEMADAATYMTMLNEIDNYRGLGDRYSQEQINCHRNQEDPWLCPDTDWFDEALKPISFQSRADMSVSGGSESVKYYLSFSGLTEDGYYENSATRYNEYSFRSNIDGQLSDYISLSFDALGRFEDRNFPTESAGQTFRMLMRGKPNEHGFWPNGLPAPDIENGTNPVVTGTDDTGYDDDERYYFQSNVRLKVDIPGVDGLAFEATASYDKDFLQRKRWQTPWTLYSLEGFDTNGDGVADGMDSSGEPVFNSSLVPNQDANLQQWSETGDGILLNLVGTYQQDVGDHSYSVLLGAERQESNNAGFWAFRRFYPSTQIDILDVGGEDQQDLGGGSRDVIDQNNKEARLNYFTRLNYNYQSKYLFEFVGRYDGSYIFPEGERFGFFPSFSLGWRLSQEDWFQNATNNFFDELKLRTSWGQTGNDRIEEWQFLSTYTFGGGYIFNNSVMQSIFPGRTPNPNVTWEVANQFDVGIETAVFDNQLSIEFDYFNYLREDILWWRNASVPQTAGLELPRENIGEVKSWGFDGTVSWRKQFGSNFLLDLSLNGGYATNEIQYWDEPPGAPEWQQSTGRMMEAPLLYRVIGVFNDQAEVESYPHWDNARPGDLIFEDVNDDGVINSDDRVRVERTDVPKWNGGLNISGQYKAFDFTMLIQGAAGASQWIQTQSGDFGNYFQEFAENRWTPDNPDASGPRAFQREEEYWISQQNTYFYLNTDYVRLKNLEIGYNAPSSFTSQIGLDRLRIYANGFNLLTFSDFWMDPEAREASGSYYPQKRVINLGLSLSF